MSAKEKTLSSQHLDFILHDISNPLAFVLGSFQLANKLDPKKKISYIMEHFDDLLDSMEMMNNIIKSSTVYIHNRDLVKVDINLCQLAKKIFGYIVDKNEPVVFNCHEDDVMAKADKDIVAVIFLNLINNAFKYMKTDREAWIEFGVDHSFKEVTYYIRDNGIGFPSSYNAEIFKYSVRAKNAKDSGVAGRGIGLQTVKTLVEAHGGKIWADGVENEGATFYFTLK